MAKNNLSTECTEFLQKHADTYAANEWGSFEQWIAHLYINIEDFTKAQLRGSLYDLSNIQNAGDMVLYAIEFIRFHLNED